MGQIIMRCFVFILLLEVSYAACVHAATGNQQPIRLTTGMKSEQQTIKPEDATVLKAQVDLMKEFNQSILSTVYWSLGTIVVIAVLLVGFSWFTNYKIYERELIAIKQELTNLINTQINNFTTESKRESEKRFYEISTKSVEMANKISQEAITPLIAKDNRLAKDIFGLRFDLTKSQANYWELKGVKGNQLRFNIELLEMAIKMEASHEIPELMDVIKKLLAEKTITFTTDVAKISDLINGLPPKYSVGAEALRNALKQANTI